MLTAGQMRALPEFFADLPDPRRAQGQRHPLPVVLAIAAGAILCGMRSYKAIAQEDRPIRALSGGCRHCATAYRYATGLVPQACPARSLTLQDSRTGQARTHDNRYCFRFMQAPSRRRAARTASPDSSPVVWKKAVRLGIICSGSIGYACRRGRPYEHRV
jgi:hypothetical protein